ncbi:hypothetical protein TruAng_001900 [Truncatella angustata]|nr:hypothetical protein TruAng_001900 [Truncatella angustata]
MMDLTTENITENVQIINSKCSNRRLNSEEWMATLEFLTKVGQTCTSTRQEFILLSDILGVSLLVDAIDHPKPKGSTEGTVLGPFHTDEAKNVDNGVAISGDPEGEPLLVVCTVRDLAGKMLENVAIDVWETDSKGFYDVQYKNHDGPEGRAVLTSDKEGRFWFKAIVPVPYPIPNDGPTSDAVFGVKNTLAVDLHKVKDESMAAQYGVKVGCTLMVYDFVLVTKEEALNLRYENAKMAMKAQGKQMRFIDGLPIPDVD